MPGSNRLVIYYLVGVMASKSRIFTVLFFLLVISSQATSQKILSFFNLEEDGFEMSFIMTQNLIILPVSINGSTQMNFVLDSGIASTIITELTGVDSISLNYVRELTLAGLGSGEPGTAFASTGNTIVLKHPDFPRSGIMGLNMDIYVLAEDHFNLSKQLGMQINGLIGSEFFASFIIEIDYSKKIISFRNPEKFKRSYRYRKFKEIPLHMVGKKAFVIGKMLQEEGESIDLKMLIDTGASLPMWIAAHSDPGIIIPEQTIPALLGQGLNGPIEGVNARIKGFEFADHIFKNPVVSFPDSTSVIGMLDGYYRNGSLGNDILRRFTIVFDFPHKRLLVKANGDINDSFSYNKSGMVIEKPYFNVPIYSVFNIVPNSPADLAGVKEGDQLLILNSQAAKNMSMDEINTVLHGHNGQSIRIRVLRNGKNLKIKFRLSNEI